MVADADPQRADEKVTEQAQGDAGPTEKQRHEGQHRQQMDKRDADQIPPIDFQRLSRSRRR